MWCFVFVRTSELQGSLLTFGSIWSVTRFYGYSLLVSWWNRFWHDIEWKGCTFLAIVFGSAVSFADYFDSIKAPPSPRCQQILNHWVIKIPQIVLRFVVLSTAQVVSTVLSSKFYSSLNFAVWNGYSKLFLAAGATKFNELQNYKRCIRKLLHILHSLGFIVSGNMNTTFTTNTGLFIPPKMANYL